MARLRRNGATAPYLNMVGVTYLIESPDGDVKPYAVHTNLEHFRNVHAYVHSLPENLDYNKSEWYSFLKEGFEFGTMDAEDMMNAALHYLAIDDIAASGMDRFSENGVGFFVTLHAENYNTPSIVATSFSEWLGISKDLMTALEQGVEVEEEDELELCEQELTVIKSPESLMKEDIGQSVNLISISAWIFDEDDRVHNKMFKCTRDLVEKDPCKNMDTPEFRKMKSSTTKAMILQALKDCDESDAEMDLFSMLIEHLAIQEEARGFLDRNPGRNLSFQMSVNSSLGESTQVQGFYSDEPELNLLD